MHRTSGENQNKFVQFSVLSTSTTCLEIDPALALSRRSQYVEEGRGRRRLTVTNTALLPGLFTPLGPMYSETT